MARRSKRERIQGKRDAPDPGHEIFAKMTEPVVQSEAYHALPDWARSVLVALLIGATHENNGMLALTPQEAAERGVADRWKLYAGLKLLCLTDLIIKTRQGRLEKGKKICSLYGCTWRGIVQSNQYDATEGVSPLPSNKFAKWKAPPAREWRATVQQIANAARGRKSRTPEISETKNPVSNRGGNGRANRGGTENVRSVPTVVVMKRMNSVPTMVDTSENLGGGSSFQHIGCGTKKHTPAYQSSSTIAKKIRRITKELPHLQPSDIARACGASVDVVHTVLQEMR